MPALVLLTQTTQVIRRPMRRGCVCVCVCVCVRLNRHDGSSLSSHHAALLRMCHVLKLQPRTSFIREERGHAAIS